MKSFKVEKPWGNFEQFSTNENATVKLLHVEPNEALSLQFHYHRDELWRVIDGIGAIVIGKKTIPVKKGDEFFIPRKTTHQITTTHSSLTILEISFGKFDENDIVRLEDKYNRIPLNMDLKKTISI